MKNCTITFKFGENEHSIIVSEEELYGQEGERSLPVDVLYQRLAKILKELNNKWEDIKDKFIEYLKTNSAVSYAVTYDQISKKEGLVPNVNAKYILNTYPEIEFPDSNVPILLLDNLDAKSNYPVSGRVLDKDGKEIFIVKGDKDSLALLAEYLKIRDKVLNEDWISNLDDDDELKPALLKIASKLKKDVNEIMLEFLNNKTKIRDSGIVVNGRSAYTILNLIGNIIKDTPSKKLYKNPLLNEFNQRLKGRENGDITLKVAEIARYFQKEFPHIVTAQKVFKELFTKKSSEIIKTISELKKLNSKEELLLELLKQENAHFLELYPDKDLWGISMLFNAVNTLVDIDENPLSIRPLTIKDGNIIFADKYPTFKSAYGYSYDTVASFTKEESKYGYNIYSQKREVGNQTQTVYFVTPYFINEDLEVIKFASLLEAQKWVEKTRLTRKLRVNAFDNLKEKYVGNLKQRSGGRTFESKLFIPEGTVFSIIDMPLDIRSTSMNPKEYEFVQESLGKTLLDFYDYIDTWEELTDTFRNEIKNKIDTAEKAVIFLSEINRDLNTFDEQNRPIYPRNNRNKINEIITRIDTKKPSYYYVSKSFKVAKDTYRIHYIRTDESVTTTKRVDKRAPITQLLNGIAREMQEKFGVPVHIVDELKLTEMGIEDLNLVKAFIHKGEIYINKAIAKGSDAFHEYAHLFLGAMKANPELRESYVELIDKVLSTEEGLKALNKKIKDFPKRSRIDLSEEVVADLYGQYMDDNLPYELSSLFTANDKIKQMLDTIFDRKDKGKSIKNFKGGIEAIWRHFNSNVAKYLDDNISFLKDSSLLVQRLKANWINLQIENKEIIENCM